MLKGLQLAWFTVYREATRAAHRASIARRNQFGILVAKDRHALEYQYADARADHAERHLTGPAIVEQYAYPGGDLTDEANRVRAGNGAMRKRQARRALREIWQAEDSP